MAKAFFCIPSARPVEQVIPVVAGWHAQGYGVALWRDNEKRVLVEDAVYRPNTFPFPSCDLLITGPYTGYAASVNALSKAVLEMHPEVDWVVAAGDDTFPDPNKTGDEIAGELSEHFRRLHSLLPPTLHIDSEDFVDGRLDTFGVCQPTGDRWADDLGVIIERIAGSPWLGREWCRRAHGGRGPLWPEFTHMFGDEALQLYAQHLGVFLQRPDLTHYHAHALRDTGDGVDARKRAPDHMAPWNTRKHWDESKAIFERLKAENFASCMPIP